MADQFLNYEQIDRYLTNKMSGIELADFERELSLNKELQEEVDLQVELRDVVIGASLSEVRSLMDNDLNENLTKGSNNKWWLGGLATIALILGLLYVSQEEPVSQQQSKLEQKEAVHSDVKTEQTISKKTESSEVKVLSPEEEVTVTKEKSDVVLNTNNDNTKAVLIPEKDNSTTDEKTSISNENSSKVTNQVKDTYKPVVKEKAATKTENKSVKAEGLSFNGKLKTTVTAYNESSGQIAIDGNVVGGKAPYQYFIFEDELQDELTFYDLKSGKYIVKVIDFNSDTLILGEVAVKETKCITDYNKSFVISYDQYWELPVVDENVYTFTVFNPSGVVFEKTFELGDENQWNGETLTAERAKVGYYRFEIKYSSGEQCFGELTIGN